MKKNTKTKLKKYQLFLNDSIIHRIRKGSRTVISLDSLMAESPYQLACQLHKQLNDLTGGKVAYFNPKTNEMSLATEYLANYQTVKITEYEEEY